MPLAQLRLVLWLLLALGLGAIGTWAGMALHARGAASRQPTIDALTQRLATLTATTTAASAEALRRQQEAAQATRRAEDEAQAAVDAALALVAAGEVQRAADADSYRDRLRAATARACSGGQIRDARLPRAAESEARPATRGGSFSESLADDLGTLAGDADRLVGQYRICYSALSTGREIVRRQ